ncbi:MAG: hypothetical protein P9L92_14350 [Candidatus Electryonea clarkiae]|nr:hypothetical protein [Candidatus Electryonea clarkiae]MDP8288572.1 hypothetical protein [Candidatus Electryonea clarkiae]
MYLVSVFRARITLFLAFVFISTFATLCFSEDCDLWGYVGDPV